mgnify:CR=1 FL=1
MPYSSTTGSKVGKVNHGDFKIGLKPSESPGTKVNPINEIEIQNLSSSLSS